MKIFLLFIVFASVMAIECTDDRVISCLTTWLGTTNITDVDINNYTLNQPCGRDPTDPNGYAILAACDKDGDGGLTVADYYDEHSCIRGTAYMYTICRLCEICEAFSV